MTQFQSAGKPFARHGFELDIFALFADGERPPPCRANRRDDARCDLAVRVDNSGLAGPEQIAEQPQLGGEIFLLGRVIIHVIARQVGEAGRSRRHPVEPLLIQPMRRSLHR